MNHPGEEHEARVISDEAVEAAVPVILRGIDEGHHAYKIAYAALEAAAPHMLAEARAEAWDACADMPSRPTKSDNPYRNEP